MNHNLSNWLVSLTTLVDFHPHLAGWRVLISDPDYVLDIEIQAIKGGQVVEQIHFWGQFIPLPFLSHSFP